MSEAEPKCMALFGNDGTSVGCAQPATHEVTYMGRRLTVLCKDHAADRAKMADVRDGRVAVTPIKEA